MKNLLCYVLLSMVLVVPCYSVEEEMQDEKGEQEYRIDQPGTITFTVGVKIKGKIEKPQVMIFLPKEKTIYKAMEFNRSFRDDLSEPLPFTPITD